MRFVASFALRCDSAVAINVTTAAAVVAGVLLFSQQRLTNQRINIYDEANERTNEQISVVK